MHNQPARLVDTVIIKYLDSHTNHSCGGIYTLDVQWILVAWESAPGSLQQVAGKVEEIPAGNTKKERNNE